MNTIEKILKGLNEKQKEAVISTEGYIRIIAGAGSGKTKTLTSRFVYIIEGLGISTSNVVCVTFTNKAAHEMRKRIKSLLGDLEGNVVSSFLTTYHGLCVRILREDINKLNYPKGFIIIDEEDQKTIIREIYEELGMTLKNDNFTSVLRNISYRKNDYNYIEFLSELSNKQDIPKGTGTEDNIFIKYLLKQKKNFALDFDDLMNFTLFIFDNNADILEKWQDRFHYIQVDEFQDSSQKQYKFILMLSQKHKNLFVVGDPDQTIYEWRGADPEIIVNFDSKVENCKTIILDENYRSTPEILNVGNSIIKHNKVRVEKNLFTKNLSGLTVEHFHGKAESEESIWIVNKIKFLIQEQNVKLNEIAILYRANYVSRMIEQALLKEGINYIIYGGVKFFERKEIKDALSYLRLCQSTDDISFLRVINIPSRGIGKQRIKFLKEKAEEENALLYDVLKSNINNSLFENTKASEFIELIESIKENVDNLSVSDLLQVLLEKSGYFRYIREDGDQERLDNITELINSIIEIEKTNGEKVSLSDYLQEITLYTDFETKNENDRIKLMTIHISKGLEFPYVFICGLSEGILPNYRALQDRKRRALEEERRLVYVGITRAMKNLYLTESEGFYNYGQKKYPSRFIFEIEKDFVIQKGSLESSLLDEAREQIVKSECMLDNNNEIKSTFNIGDDVLHPVWKKGTIISLDNKKKEYYIKFENLEDIKPINMNYKFITRT